MSTTICVECKHHRHIVKNRAAPHVWYNHFCGAVEHAPVIDCVTGERGFSSGNDLGRGIVTQDQFAYCRDINQGNCEYFSPAKEAHRPA